MNETLNISKQFPITSKITIEHLRIDEADMKTMRDMPALLKDTKKYIQSMRKGITNG